MCIGGKPDKPKLPRVANRALSTPYEPPKRVDPALTRKGDDEDEYLRQQRLRAGTMASRSQGPLKSVNPTVLTLKGGS